MADPRDVNCQKFAQVGGFVTGVELTVREHPASKYRLHKALLIPEAQSAGQHVATCSAVDAGGIPTGDPVFLTWGGFAGAGQGRDIPFDEIAPSGSSNNVHVITNPYDPSLKLGPLCIKLGDGLMTTDSDVVGGIGLPGGHHVSFVFIFVMRGSAGPDVDPGLAQRLQKIEEQLVELAKGEILDDALDATQTTNIAGLQTKSLSQAQLISALQLRLTGDEKVIVNNRTAVKTLTTKLGTVESLVTAHANRLQAQDALIADLFLRLNALENGQGGDGNYKFPLASHKFGVHLIPDNDLQKNIDFIRKLKPAAVKVINGNKETLQLVLSLLDPNGLLIIRDHARSEQQDFLQRDPEACGHQHALEWKKDLLDANGKYYGLNSSRVLVCLLNEPPVGDAAKEETLVKYTTAALNDLTTYGIRALCLNLSVGWPRNLGGSTPPNWFGFKGLEEIINRGSHVLGLHEYFYADPDEGWSNLPNGTPFGWLAQRHHACPLRVPLLIGEFGMTKAVDETRWINDGRPPRGWVGNATPSQYAEMFARYTKKTSANVLATMLFTSGFASEDWREDSTLTAHADIIARKVPHTFPAGFPIRPPAAGSVVLPPPPPPGTSDPDLLILPKIAGLVTGFYGDVYKNAAGVAYSHEGLDLRKLTGTPVLMPSDGIIAHVGTAAEASPYGLYIRTIHRDLDVCFFIAHLSKTMVKDGDVVKQGTVIGLSGNSGNSSGPHEHFEVRFLVEGQLVYEPETSAHANARGDIISYVRGFKHYGRIEYR